MQELANKLITKWCPCLNTKLELEIVDWFSADFVALITWI